MAGELKLGMTFGYWGKGPNPNMVEQAQAAEAVGFDSIWTAESWGNDAFSFATWMAAHTKKVRIGTGIVQMAARTPVATAMAAATIDHLSGGRFILGLGVSGPQVVEGWYGQPSARPLARTREYVEIIRRALARDEGPLDFQGEFYQHPYSGPGSVGLGKPLKMMIHPLRKEIPIFMGAEGPKNVTQTAEIADGWLPLYYSPFRQDVYADQLANAKPGFEITALVNFTVTDDVASALLPVKGGLAFYIGGMGAKGQNYHTKLMQRMGFEEEALKIQDLFFQGKRDEAILAVPD
ncbi:MAG: class F420-dependent oxidoreductase, partial [Actinomycetia bacterium]|nr:class F420-dependent oxidoreductase [Actinomycetes bacterium]